MISGFEWQFGGWLRALPGTVAWGALGAVALGGLAIIVFSYGRTLQGLSRARRWLFTAFRLLMLLLVLLCLANPVRVDRAAHHDAPKRTLSVLVDRSGSMGAKDNRSRTRLENAVQLWNRHADELKQSFDRVDYYRFSSNAVKTSGLDEALKAGDPGTETRLYDALNQLLDPPPAGIVCLTDGLDTTGQQAGELIAKAQRLSVPIYFVAGTNRTRPPEYMCIREIKMPSQVLRHSQFTASVAVEIASNAGGELPLELWNKGQMVASTKLNVRPGLNLLPWSVAVNSKEPEAMQLEFRAGEGERRDVATATTQVVDKTEVNVLYYQGALLWGYRYLLTALEGDPSFHMSAILNPGLNMQLTSSTPDGPAMHDLPEDAAALKHFQIVILANIFADQLSSKQQGALVDYVKNGGAVLFIAPDSDSTERFAGTPLEQMLPIVFAPPQQAAREGQVEKDFQQRMNDAGGADGGMETAYADQMIGVQTRGTALLPFTAPPGGDAKASRLFQPGPNAPKFADYAKVNNVKPGAEILAVHPTERVKATGAPRVLIARQTFGAGSSAVMTTDLLWRWKMSLPSESRVMETFWQQFMLMLAHTTSGRGLRLEKDSVTTQTGRPAVVRVDAAGNAPKVEATSPSGVKTTLTLEPMPGNADGQQVKFTPDAEGRWQVAASDSAGNFARITIPVIPRKTQVESTDDPADVEGLRRIAEATGGALVDNSSPAIRPRVDAPQPPETKSAQPLWNTRWLIAALLGIYAAELVARRMAKLL